MTAHPLADPAKLRELATSWRTVSDDRGDCFEEIAASLDAGASAIESQSRELAELRAERARPIASGNGTYLMVHHTLWEQTAERIAELKSQLAAAESLTDNLRHQAVSANAEVARITAHADGIAAELAAAEAARDDERRMRAEDYEEGKRLRLETIRERDALAKRLALLDSCIVCGGAFVPDYHSPPHCDDCVPTDEHFHKWDDAIEELRKDQPR